MSRNFVFNVPELCRVLAPTVFFASANSARGASHSDGLRGNAE